MVLNLAAAGEMRVEVFNLLGQSVKTLASGYKEAGTYNLSWDASEAAGGLYFVKAQAGGFTQTRKLVLLK